MTFQTKMVTIIRVKLYENKWNKLWQPIHITSRSTQSTSHLLLQVDIFQCEKIWSIRQKKV